MFDEILNGLEKLLAANSTTRLDTAFFELVLKRLESFGYTAVKEDGWLLYYIGASVEQKIKNECNTAAIPGGLLYKAVDMVCGEFLYQKFNSIIFIKIQKKYLYFYFFGISTNNLPSSKKLKQLK